MKVLVIGATGAIGRPLVTKLAIAGHDVVAAARRAPAATPPGVDARALDLLDASTAETLVARLAPDAIIHQATALASVGNNVRRFDALFATTNRLRTEGTTTLIRAARRLPTQPRLIVQSFCGWPWAPEGGPVKSEGDRWNPHPAPAFRRTFAALAELEAMVNDYPNGVVLRYGALYGPGTTLAGAGPQIEAIQRRRFPLVGRARAVWSFIHVEDAADATIAALTRGGGVYNIVDDTPVPIGEWLVAVSQMLSAPPPFQIPVWLARLVGGSGLVHMMTQARGSSNAKAKRELDWAPAHPDWRTGFASELTRADGSQR